MNTTEIVIIVVAVLVVIGVAVMLMRKREGERLKERFGSEYHRQVDAAGSETKAQAELLKREKRVEKFDIHPLPPEQREAFAADWQQVQARFVDDPERSIALADALLAEVMKARGYPVENFEQRAGDLSVEHPELVANYRAAHEIAERRAQGRADTEDLRSALLGYRNLFDELLHADAGAPAH